MEKHDPKLAEISLAADPAEALVTQPAYRRPELYQLGSLEQVQAYYTGPYRDGPCSSYWYNG